MKRMIIILLRNPLSLLGLILVSLVLLAAIFADFIAPFPDHRGAVVDFVHFNQGTDEPQLYGNGPGRA